MDKKCSTNGGEVHTVFWWDNLRKGNHLEDRGVNGRIILNWIFEKGDGEINCIDLAQYRDR
jgi:hypothetical protein